MRGREPEDEPEDLAIASAAIPKIKADNTRTIVTSFTVSSSQENHLDDHRKEQRTYAIEGQLPDFRVAVMLAVLGTAPPARGQQREQ
jgi:hypothetical protein